MTIEIGKWFNRKLAWLERSNIPPAVSAGLLVSLLLALPRKTAVLDVELTTAPRDVLLLVFFATLGMAAHLGRLMTAWRTALVICVAILAAITLQNGTGVLVAEAFGEPAALPGAFEIGIGSATLGLIVGGLVAGPTAGWLMARARTDHAAGSDAQGQDAVLTGLKRALAQATGLDLPAFLAAMLVGVAVMRRLNARYGDTPRPLLGITIAASLFQDFANAVLLTLAFRWFA